MICSVARCQQSRADHALPSTAGSCKAAFGRLGLPLLTSAFTLWELGAGFKGGQESWDLVLVDCLFREPRSLWRLLLSELSLSHLV